MRQYSWPGNLRELRNVIERAVILETTDVIRIENLPTEIVNPGIEKRGPASSSPSLPPLPAEESLPEGSSLFEIEKQTIIQALEKSGYNQTKAAEILKISRDTLRYRMRKFRL